MRRRKIIVGLAGVTGAAAFTLGLGAWMSPEPDAPASRLPLPLDRMTWRLTDDRGQPVTPQDWLGRASVVFFGFTWCPDVCPTTLMDISDWLEDLGPDADRLAVSLVTVDPARDTPEVLAEYVANFDPRIRGLTGTEDQTARVAEEFRAFYERIPSEDGDYTMNHTAGVFLFRPDGRLASVIDFHEDRSFAVPKIRRALE